MYLEKKKEMFPPEKQQIQKIFLTGYLTNAKIVQKKNKIIVCLLTTTIFKKCFDLYPSKQSSPTLMIFDNKKMLAKRVSKVYYNPSPVP